jgi:hypothetical protein
MPLENLKRANAMLKELNKQRISKEPQIRETWKKMTAQSPIKERKPPKDFKDSSYLYIRSYDGDNGVRPGAGGVPYWKSPDLNVSPLSSLNSYTTELNVGTVYNLECLVHNRGDIIVPSAKVEFYLVTPSLGFDTRFAKKLGVTSTWVNCYASAKVNIQYLVPPADAGHRCLFARVFSFSPLDIPVHDTLLNPYQDRHIGQKNLNIAPQASAMQINLLHMPQAQITIQFLPMKREAIMAMRHPSAADFKIIDNEVVVKMSTQFKLGFAEKNIKAKLELSRGVANFGFEEKSKFSLDEQKKVHAQIQEINKIIQTGNANPAKFKKQIAAYRKMNLENKMTMLNLQIPNIGLQKGEMAGFEIVATNKVNAEVFGGITLLVIGK